jgi:hypothetical protein
MADELNEWILDELAGASPRSEHVHDTIVWIHEAQPEDDAGLVEDVETAKARDTFIPDTCKELLHIRMSNK